MSRLHLELIAACGSVASGPILECSFGNADTEHTVLAILTLDLPNNGGTERVVLSGDAWRELECSGDFEALNRIDALLEDEICGQINQCISEYSHCGTTWQDTWSCACDDECPVCGADVSPISHEFEGELVADEEGVLQWTTKEPPKRVEDSPIVRAYGYGYRVHRGTPAEGAHLAGRWWWTLFRPGWGETEVAPGDFATSADAWQSAIAAHAAELAG